MASELMRHDRWRPRRAAQSAWRWTGLLVVVSLALLAHGPAYPARHALLIGIGDYSAMPRLQGPRNDIPLVRNLLITRFGVRAQDIVVLQDAQATHTGIQRAFADLASRVASSDFVYIHYSGHGSQLQSRGERGGLDQTWVPHAARTGKLQGIDDYDILDKEINAWLQALYAKTNDVVFVSDSCHSATVTRAAGSSSKGVRAAPPDPRPHPLARASFANPAGRPGVRIGAARDRETAKEMDPADGMVCKDDARCYGAFTWNWVQVLSQVQSGERWRDVFKRTYARVVAMPFIGLQQPQFEGEGDRPVFGGEFAAPVTSIAVARIGRNGAVILDAGAVAGVTAGSTYRHSGSGGSDAGVLEVTKVGPFESEAAIRRGQFRVGDLVTETLHRYATAPIPLFVAGTAEAGGDAALVAVVRAAVATLPGFVVADDVESAEWVLHVVRPRRMPSDADELPARTPLPPSIPGGSPELWVTDRQGALLHGRMRIPLRDPEAGVALLTRNLGEFAHAAEVKALASPATSVPVEVTATVLRPDPGCGAECVYLPGDAGKTRPYRKLATRDLAELEGLRRDDVLTFALRNTAADDRYGYLINIGSDASVHAVFPVRGSIAEEARLKRGETRDLARETGLRLASPGTETIKVIASEAPLDVTLLESAGYARLRTTRGAAGNLAQRLTAGGVRRGTSNPAAWGALQFELQVQP